MIFNSPLSMPYTYRLLIFHNLKIVALTSRYDRLLNPNMIPYRIKCESYTRVHSWFFTFSGQNYNYNSRNSKASLQTFDQGTWGI